jgi:hypothetical protein
MSILKSGGFYQAIAICKSKYFSIIQFYFMISFLKRNINDPTKHYCILVPAPFFAPYLHQFSSVKINAIWDAFSEQH